MGWFSWRVNPAEGGRSVSIRLLNDRGPSPACRPLREPPRGALSPHHSDPSHYIIGKSSERPPRWDKMSQSPQRFWNPWTPDLCHYGTKRRPPNGRARPGSGRGRFGLWLLGTSSLVKQNWHLAASPVLNFREPPAGRHTPAQGDHNPSPRAKSQWTPVTLFPRSGFVQRPRSGTGYRRRAFDCGLKVVVAMVISTRSG